MADMYWGPANSVWSDTTNWFFDIGFGSPAGRIPLATDDVWLGGGAGSCTLDVNADCDTFYLFNGATSFNDIFDMAGFTLETRYDCRLDSSGGSMQWLMPGNSELILHALSVASVDFYTVTGMTLGRVRCKFTHGSGSRSIDIRKGCTINTLIIDQPGVSATGSVRTLTGTGVDIHDLQYVGAGPKELNSTDVSRPFRLHTDFDTREFTQLQGYYEFGFDNDVTISLQSALDFAYGARWELINSEDAANRVITIAAPDGQGNLYLSDRLTIQNRGDNAADLHVLFSGDIRRYAASYASNLGDLRTLAPTYGDATTRLTFSAGIALFVHTYIDLQYATEVNGDPATSFILAGGATATTDLYTPDDVPLSIGVAFGALGNTVATLTIHNKAYLLGDLEITSSSFFNRAVRVNGSTFRVNNVRMTWDASTARPELRNWYGAGARWDVVDIITVPIGAPTTHALVDASNADVHVTGDLNILSTTWTQTVGKIHFHIKRNNDQQLILDHGDTSSFTTFVVELDDATPGGGSNDFFFNISATQAHFPLLQILNSIDAQFKVVILPTGSNYLSAGTMEIQGRGNACLLPPIDEFAVLLSSATPATPANITLTSAAYPTFTKFTDIDSAGSTIFADDGTCFDGGNNPGDIVFEGIAPAIAICPVQSASFFAYRYANLPAAKTSQIINIGVGEMEEPTASGLANWLNASFSDNGDGTWTLSVQPSTTDLAAGVYTDTFAVNVADARRSPQSFAVTFETSEDVIPLPDVSEVDFYQLRAQTFPTPETVGVDNTFPAGGPMAQIVVAGLPSWLDVAYTVPGPADHQEFTLTVNAVGLALGSGTYNATITISAANAVESYSLPVEMVVERILIDTDVNQLTFAMQVGGALPYETTVNVSNNGSAGTLAGVTAVSSKAWLDVSVIGSGSGNSQNILVALNAGAQALAVGTHTAQITIDSSNADNVPVTVAVELVVRALEPFVLNPTSVTFAPGRDWTLPAPQQVIVVGTDEGPFAIPVVVTGAPAWLQVTIDATIPTYQVITLTPTAIPTDVDDFEATLVVTGSYSLSLPVSMTVPAFFRRPNCQMDFIPRVEGTIIEECEIPAVPPPAPIAPLVTPPQPAPTYPKNITMTGPPCIDCTAWVEYDGEGETGYGSPHYYIECEDHGCDGENLSSGTYGSGDNTPGGHPDDKDIHVTAIYIDECGHVCGIYFDEEGS